MNNNNRLPQPSSSSSSSAYGYGANMYADQPYPDDSHRLSLTANQGPRRRTRQPANDITYTPHVERERRYVRDNQKHASADQPSVEPDDDSCIMVEPMWKCVVCYTPGHQNRVVNSPSRSFCIRCNAPKDRSTANGHSSDTSYPGFPLTGDNDASPDDTPSQFLLLRGLEPGVSEEMLAKGVSKLCKTSPTTAPTTAPTTDGPKVKRLKTSSTSDAGLGAQDGSLRRVLLVRDKTSNDSWRYGFAEFNTVEDAQAALAKYRASEKFTIASKVVRVSYIHAGVFMPPPPTPTTTVDYKTFGTLSNPAMRLMYWDENAFASELVTAATGQPSATVAKDSWFIKPANCVGDDGLVSLGKHGEARLNKRKLDKDQKAVAPPHLQLWASQHAEIHGTTPKEPTDASPDSVPDNPKKKVDMVSFSLPSQTDLKFCLLCSRKFKTEAHLKKHEQQSQLHLDYMKIEEDKLNKSQDSEPEASNYRDRAKERRQAFNQPKQPPQQHNRTAEDPEDEDGIPVQSKGAALLGKMGWKAGEGLGAQGTGMTEAIATDLYSRGVGLGAQGGKVGDAIEEAQRQTKGGSAEFVTKTKEKAKERYESMK